MKVSSTHILSHRISRRDNLFLEYDLETNEFKFKKPNHEVEMSAEMKAFIQKINELRKDKHGGKVPILVGIASE